MFIKNGDKFQKLDGFKLVDVKEEDIDAESATDMTETISDADKLSIEDLNKKVDEKRAAWKKAGEVVKTDKTEEALLAQYAAKQELAVLANLLDTKKAIVDAIGEDEEPETSEETEETDEQKTEETETSEESETSETGGDQESGREENDQPDTFTAEHQAIIDAATEILAKESVKGTGELVQANGSRPSIIVKPKPLDRFNRSSIEPADFTTAEGQTMDSAQEVYRYTSEIMNGMTARSRGLRGRAGDAVSTDRKPIGSYKTNTGELIDTENSLQANNNFFRGMNALNKPERMIQAAADGVCDIEHRREIPDCGLDVQDLRNLFETYPSRSCKFEFKKALELNEITEGYGIWDEAAKQALCDARDAWKAALAAQDPAAVTAALAEMQLAEKSPCGEPKCAPVETTQNISIWACNSYSIEQADCSPEAIQAQRNLLFRKFDKLKNAALLRMLSNNADKIITADASAFTSGGIQLDAGAFLHFVLMKLDMLSKVLDQTVEGRPTMIVPAGMLTYLQFGSGLSCYSGFRDEFASSLSKYNIVETGEAESTEDDPCPPLTGVSIPPAPAEGPQLCDITDIDIAGDFSVYVQYDDDFFLAEQPDVNLSAEITHDSVKQNRYAREFAECTYSLNKDGCRKSYRIDFTNMCPNGAYVGCASPADSAVCA